MEQVAARGAPPGEQGRREDLAEPDPHVGDAFVPPPTAADDLLPDRQVDVEQHMVSKADEGLGVGVIRIAGEGTQEDRALQPVVADVVVRADANLPVVITRLASFRDNAVQQPLARGLVQVIVEPVVNHGEHVDLVKPPALEWVVDEAFDLHEKGWITGRLIREE